MHTLDLDQSPADAAIGADRASVLMRITILLAVVLPFLGLMAAIAFLWGRGFSWVQLGLLVGMYHLTAIGVTVGFHRLFTHRAFETTRTIQVVLGILGSMSVQGPLLKWVAVHRRHHQLSDSPGDPHSPHLHGHGLLGMLRGIWHAHTGWLFEPDAPGLPRYVGDLQPDRLLRAVSALFPLWVAVGLVLPAALGGLLTGTWWGVLLGCIWGGLARVFLVHHMTWSINSICHLWGGQPFRSRDQSRNNVLFGILGLGEGWHNNHHAFPTSARHGLRWWQIDVSYLIIRALSAMRLAWKVRLPAPEFVASRLQKRHEDRIPDAGGESAVFPAARAL
jgi:stearoyl-CoA desaturase (Delta-9 desaturase)